MTVAICTQITGHGPRHTVYGPQNFINIIINLLSEHSIFFSENQLQAISHSDNITSI